MRTIKHVIPAAACLGMVAVAIAVWSGGNPAGARTHADGEGSRERVLKAYANLPLTFEENQRNWR